MECNNDSNINFLNVSMSAPHLSTKRNKGKSLIDFPNNFCIVDLETTGLDPTIDEIIEISCIKIRNNIKEKIFASLIKPSEPIDPFIESLTGISNEILKDAPPLKQTLKDCIDFIGSDIIVGHNVNFDINFLYDNCLRIFGYEYKNNFIDTMRLSRRIIPELPHHRLKDMIKHYSIGTKVEHRALSDCIQTLSLFQNLKEDAILKYSSIDDFKSYCTKKKKRKRDNHKPSIKASDIVPSTDEFDISHPLYNKVCVFTGKLEKIKRKDAYQMVVDIGGLIGDSVTKKTNFLILGNNDYCSQIKDGKSNKQKRAEELILKEQDLKIISENVFYDLFNI